MIYDRAIKKFSVLPIVMFIKLK